MSKAPAQPVTGSIIAVSGIAGPADSIRYTVRINMPGGGTVTIPDVRPTVPSLWAGFDVRPFPVGWPVANAYIVGKTLVWYDGEAPDFEDCEGPQPQPVPELDPLAGVALDQNGQPTGGGGGLSGGFSGGGGTVADVGIGGSTK
jgi:hypothetical protein